MLDDDARRSGVAKLGDQLERRIGVVVVVVAQRLALGLLGHGDAAMVWPAGQIEGRLLMRILAVAQLGAALIATVIVSGKISPWSAERTSARSPIVGGGGGEGLGGETLAQIERRHAATRIESCNQLGIVAGIGNDGDIGMVLGGRAHHRGPADVDILDHFFAAGASGTRLGEGIEVDDDEVDRADAVLHHRRGMGRIVADGEQPAMDLGWSVLTRPSIISGKPVKSEMSRTSRPASRKARAVPPVETSSTPCRASA